VQTPCSLRDYLYKKYNGNISALNAAWGSNYTTFDSTGVAHTGEVIAIGDGSTKSFSATLSHSPVSMYSVYLYTGSTTPTGGDANGALQAAGGFWLPNHSYPKASYVTDSNGYVQFSQLGGRTGSAAPGWRTVIGATTTDNTITWTNAGVSPTVGVPIWNSGMTWTPNSGAPTMSFYTVLRYHFSSGSPYSSRNSRQVGDSSYATRQIPTIVAPQPDPYAAATGYDVYAGCMSTGAATWGCTGNGVTPVLTLQASNVPLSANWTPPISGLTVGGALPGPDTVIDYSTGTIIVKFVTAPPSGVQIRMDYIENGWGYGTGLMDEDGRNTAWMGTNSWCLTPATVCDGANLPVANASLGAATDLDEWIAQPIAQYAGTFSAALKSAAPHMMFFGADTFGSWDSPPRKQVLQGAAPYVDGLFTQWFANQNQDGAKYQFITRYLGDKPLLNFMTLHAQPDSPYAIYNNATCCFGLPTQSARGQQWSAIVSSELNTLGYNSTYPWIGVVWWGSHDFPNEQIDWGLKTAKDNAYDGREAVSGAVSCSAPLSIFLCGGEPRAYGDLIAPLAAANSLWLNIH
jgi:hypothetical protein